MKHNKIYVVHSIWGMSTPSLDVLLKIKKFSLGVQCTTNNYRNSDGKIARGLFGRQWRRTSEGKLRRQMEKQISDGKSGRQSVATSFYFFIFLKNI